MTKEQIEQAAEREYPLLNEINLFHNEIAIRERAAFIKGATSPEAKAYHEGEKDEAIRELVKGLRYIEEKNYPNNTPDNYIRIQDTCDRLLTKYSNL